jgi:hypothetical protein
MILSKRDLPPPQAHDVLDRDVGPRRIIVNALDLQESELPSKLLQRYQVGWTLLPDLPAMTPLDQLPG